MCSAHPPQRPGAAFDLALKGEELTKQIAAPSSLKRSSHQDMRGLFLEYDANDPSAGSPTETLLRLLLPLSDKVH